MEAVIVRSATVELEDPAPIHPKNTFQPYIEQSIIMYIKQLRLQNQKQAWG